MFMYKCDMGNNQINIVPEAGWFLLRFESIKNMRIISKFQKMNWWEIPLAVAQAVPCLFLAGRIFSRPHLWTLFNLNTGLLFLVLGSLVIE